MHKHRFKKYATATWRDIDLKKYNCTLYQCTCGAGKNVKVPA